jgi:hypothetical protein
MHDEQMIPSFSGLSKSSMRLTVEKGGEDRANVPVPIKRVSVAAVSLR